MEVQAWGNQAMAVVGIAVGIYLTIKGRGRVRRALQSSFDALTFDTPEGKMAGTALRVVKVSKQGMPFAYDDVYSMHWDPLVHDSFWCCVGPGPCWFVAIPMVTTGFGKVSVRWVVRPLTEARMRGALIGDTQALRLAFGDKADELRV